MNADIQRRRRSDQLNGMIKRLTGGHDRSRRQDAAAMRLKNPFIDAPGKTKIVGMHNQSGSLHTLRPSLVDGLVAQWR